MVECSQGWFFSHCLGTGVDQVVSDARVFGPVKARINGREYSLSWEEFEKTLLRNDLSGGEIEVISIFMGMRPCYSFQAG